METMVESKYGIIQFKPGLILIKKYIFKYNYIYESEH